MAAMSDVWTTVVFGLWLAAFVVSIVVTRRLAERVNALVDELRVARVALAGAREQERQANLELSRARIELESKRTGETQEQVIARFRLATEHMGRTLVDSLRENR